MSIVANPAVRSRPVALPPAGAVGRARANLRVLEILDRLDTEGGSPTPDDLAALGRWSGWGPMAKALDPRIVEAPWGDLGERVRHLLRPEEAEEAEAATPNAFYTPPYVTAAAWRVLVDLGFAGGAVLEPGCGHGCFIAAAPPHLDIRVTGIERDPVTARVAALLHPAAKIVNRRLERVALPPAAYDAVIGNVPFAKVSPYDPGAPFEMRLHNYFLWRSLHALRPGGLAVLVTSRHTLDALGGEVQRRHFGDMAELLGAVRLPSGWESEYGTNAVADLLVFRRRESLGERRHASWSGSTKAAGAENALNEYWEAHSDHVLGESEERGGHRFGATLGVRFDGDRTALAAALGARLEGIVRLARRRGLTWAPAAAAAPIPEPADQSARGVAEGRLEVQEGGRLVQLRDGRWEPVERNRGELMQLVRVRDAAVALMDAESDPDVPDADELRRALNSAYDAYRERFGALNRGVVLVGKDDPETGLPKVTRRRPGVMTVFRDDPDYPRVLALEAWDDENDVGVKAPIMLRRVNRRPERATRTDNPAEAVALCLDECGRLDADVLARLLSVDAGAVDGALGDLAFRDPGTGDLLPADEYLSGNVRVKLSDARRASAADPGRWSRNVAALEPVVPEDLGPDEIKVRLGAPWVPTDVVEDFIESTVRDPQVEREPILGVAHQPAAALWAVHVDLGQKNSIAATVTWGTGRADAYQLLQWALNGQPPVIWDVVKTDKGEKRVRNVEETALADQKTQELHARFSEWVWEDPERVVRLCRLYNDKYNSSVLRPYDGSHLTFPGLAAHITPRRSQLDMVYRGITTPASLCGHDVGAGKTAIMALTAVKLRQLGLANKPLAVVPGHLLEQTAREMLQWFPAAKILMASSRDLEGYRRRLFAARCATGDWDLVVMTHEAFKSLAVDQSVEEDYLRERVRKYRQAMLDAADPRDRTVKQIARSVGEMEGRLKELLDRPRDPGVTFNQLGVDVLFYDEAQKVKNLGLPCRTPGITSGASAIAADLHMKLRWLAERQQGRPHAMLLTGTPVSNSLAEFYVFQLYLQPQRLEELDLDDINAWVALHVESETKVEVAPDGATFRQHTRPRNFNNVGDMRRTFGAVADIRTAEQLGLQRPRVVTENIAIPASEVQQRVIRQIVARVDDIHDPDVYVDPKDDNMLKACSDGRLCALDPELVGEVDDEPGKPGAVAAKVLELWRAYGGADAEQPPLPKPNADLAPLMRSLMSADGPTRQISLFEWAAAEAERERLAPARCQPGAPLQVIFSDIGTPKPGSAQTYGKVRALLVAGGMDPRRIRFVQDARTDLAKAELFAACRTGKVDVLMGSTAGLGTGTNIQNRLLAVHHMDAPWRPADVAQRLGRAQRPGNGYDTVYEFRYVVEGTFDAYMWQALERKLAFIAQVLTGDLTVREVPDIGEVVLTYTVVKALATGNARLMELAGVQADVVKFSRLQRAHQRDVRWLEAEARRAGATAQHCESRALTLTRVAERVERAWQGLAVERYERIEGRADVGQRLAREMAAAMTGSGEKREVGTYRGLAVHANAFREHKQWRLSLVVGAQGNGYEWADSIAVNPAWLEKGQTWRFAAAVDGLAESLHGEAERLRAAAVQEREACVRSLREADRPFAYAADLAAAEARRDEIEMMIRREAIEREQKVEAA